MALESYEEQAAKRIADLMNGVGKTTSAMGKFNAGMDSQHRTLQQNFTRIVVSWMEHMATKGDHECDLRNKATVELAKEFMEKIDPKYRAIPYI
jgi:hypothetical protein